MGEKRIRGLGAAEDSAVGWSGERKRLEAFSLHDWVGIIGLAALVCGRDSRLLLPEYEALVAGVEVEL